MPPTKDDPATHLLLQEVEKVNGEIKSNQEGEAACYHYRFGLIGALLAALFYVLYGENNKGYRLAGLFSDSRTLIVVGIACIVSIAIDARVRGSNVATEIVAQWLYRVAEPTLLRESLCGYEAFLRVKGGMHRDFWFGQLHWPNLQWVSALLYAVFVVVVVRIGALKRGPERMVVRLVVALVYITILWFAANAHYVPVPEGGGGVPEQPLGSCDALCQVYGSLDHIYQSWGVYPYPPFSVPAQAAGGVLWAVSPFWNLAVRVTPLACTAVGIMLARCPRAKSLPLRQRVYLSRGRGTRSRDEAQSVARRLATQGVSVVGEKAALGYRDDADFYDHIWRDGHCVFIILTDDYLRDSSCMVELIELLGERPWLGRRIVVVQEVEVAGGTGNGANAYVDRWREQTTKWETFAGQDPRKRSDLDRIRARVDLVSARIPKCLTVRGHDLDESMNTIVERLRELGFEVKPGRGDRGAKGRVAGPDAALGVAWHRALETQRADALFRDRLAYLLAGVRGERIARHMNRWSATRGAWTTVVRTWLIDELLKEAVRGGVDRVVNLAAGYDTRPYRLELPSALSWVEVDVEEILHRKAQLLQGEVARCTVTRHAADLRDARSRADTLAMALQGASRALVLTEGLPEPVACDLASELRAQAAVQSWITDLASAPVRRWMHYYARLVGEDARWRFAPAEGVGCFEPLGWRPTQVRAIVHEASRLKRLPWLLRPLARLDRDTLRPWGAVVRYQRRGDP